MKQPTGVLFEAKGLNDQDMLQEPSTITVARALTASQQGSIRGGAPAKKLSEVTD